jgi:nitrogen fixation NifU-like protein
MMPQLRELYQQVILDHSKQPRNFRTMPDAVHTAEGHNPLCGDRITIFLKLAGDIVEEVTFTGSGCAICTASASIMTQFLKGKTVTEVEHLFGQFRALVMGELDALDAMDELDKLAVFAGVRQFPLRVKCAVLPWHTIKAALEGKAAPVTTE